MFPWLWIWAPRIEFPLSGNVSQDILSDWFFSAIKPTAGNGQLEHKIFENYSYGKQLSILSDVLLTLIDGESADPEKRQASLLKLKDMSHRVEQIKSDYNQSNVSSSVEESVKLIENWAEAASEQSKAASEPYKPELNKPDLNKLVTLLESVIKEN